jgi:hypothetical protein
MTFAVVLPSLSSLFDTMAENMLGFIAK